MGRPLDKSPLLGVDHREIDCKGWVVVEQVSVLKGRPNQSNTRIQNSSAGRFIRIALFGTTRSHALAWGHETANNLVVLEGSAFCCKC